MATHPPPGPGAVPMPGAELVRYSRNRRSELAMWWREIDRVLLCSGQLYYDLEKQREQLGRRDVAILRLEQMYPHTKDRARLIAVAKQGRAQLEAQMAQERAEREQQAASSPAGIAPERSR